MAGIAAAAVALGVTQLLAAFVGPQADSRTAVGSTVIDLTPGPVKEWAITTFGTADKVVLTVAVLAVIALIAAVTASRESRRAPIGSAAIVLAGVAGCAAVLSRPGATAADTVPTIVGAVCGVAVLRLLLSGRFTDDAPKTADTADPKHADVPDPGRRRSLITLGLLTAGAVSGMAGVVLAREDVGGASATRLHCPPSTSPPSRSHPRCSPRALRCRRSSPATTTSTGSTPRSQSPS
ncbi:hypothetical protein MAGR_14480 [Mycolicibacterium agri]|uniref:Oxidoreductase n=2 Tax=Mycolicibacterium agri TaxID=36811 RepID=A0A7I9VY74_MYCAG|nr:hypothetical protein MAGR_14480 [Mycolicibacterium agri]